MASKLIAIVAGVGPGTGAAVARKFAASYPVVLLARNPDNYNDLVKEINGSGGKAIGISTDVADAKSVQNAADEIKKEFGNSVAAAVSSHTHLQLNLRIQG
jgi:NADP-dependent 3-hydroxy acid dehydrogenase YdfG